MPPVLANFGIGTLVEFRAKDRAEGRNGRAGAVEPVAVAREGMPDQA